MTTYAEIEAESISLKSSRRTRVMPSLEDLQKDREAYRERLRMESSSSNLSVRYSASANRGSTRDETEGRPKGWAVGNISGMGEIVRREETPEDHHQALLETVEVAFAEIYL